jgi:hypothetical protein
MLKSNSTDYCGSFTDDDSGIGIDNVSSSDLTSSTLTLIEPSFSTRTISPLSLSTTTTTTIKQKYEDTSLIKFPSDGIIERIRPSTMKNSQNGDFIICQTARGTYVAHRTPVVPQWITRLVQEIEFQQQ